MANARKIAALALLEVDRNQAYSNLVLNRMLGESNASSEDRSLATVLFYGVLDRQITLDYVLSKFTKTSVKGIAPYTLEVLRVGLYQLLYLTRIPQSAAVNEAVKQIKISNEKFNAAFVNGVLRNYARNGLALPGGNSVSAFSVRYSCPEWIVQSFLDDYGLENTIGILEETLKTPPVTLRVNTCRTNPARLAEMLRAEQLDPVPCAVPDALIVQGGINVRRSAAYQRGMFHVQDGASQLSIARLAPQPGETVLDMCAAPGGKSFTMAQWMRNKGKLFAYDIYEQRAKLIAQGAERLGLSCIHTAIGDASRFDANVPQANAILCDVPCSGLGVLRRKPEIKYKSPEESADLPALQRSILDNAVRYLAAGGRILYSTCTLRKEENEQIVHGFLDNHSGFALKYEHTYLPHIDHTDGFYCALIVRTE